MNTMVNKEDREMLIRIEERLKIVQHDIKGIDRALDGNGNEGLITKATRHDTEIQGITEDIKNNWLNTQWAIGISITIVLAVMGVIKFLI